MYFPSAKSVGNPAPGLSSVIAVDTTSFAPLPIWNLVEDLSI